MRYAKPGLPYQVPAMLSIAPSRGRPAPARDRPAASSRECEPRCHPMRPRLQDDECRTHLRTRGDRTVRHRTASRTCQLVQHAPVALPPRRRRHDLEILAARRPAPTRRATKAASRRRARPPGDAGSPCSSRAWHRSVPPGLEQLPAPGLPRRSPGTGPIRCARSPASPCRNDSIRMIPKVSKQTTARSAPPHARSTVPQVHPGPPGRGTGHWACPSASARASARVLAIARRSTRSASRVTPERPG